MIKNLHIAQKLIKNTDTEQPGVDGIILSRVRNGRRGSKEDEAARNMENTVTRNMLTNRSRASGPAQFVGTPRPLPRR